MNTNSNSTGMDMKALLSTLWIFVLFNIAFRDIHEFFRVGLLAACRRSPFGVVFLRFEAAFPVKIRYFRPNMSLRPSKKWNLAINPTGC